MYLEAFHVCTREGKAEGVGGSRVKEVYLKGANGKEVAEAIPRNRYISILTSTTEALKKKCSSRLARIRRISGYGPIVPRWTKEVLSKDRRWDL